MLRFEVQLCTAMCAVIMLMKCAFTTLGMHGIENRWGPLGQADDENSGLGWSVQSACLGLPAL